MNNVPASLRVAVISRAGNRCEYCQLSQMGQEAAFHIDHIVPRVADGPTVIDNLALACVSCSLRKLARQVGIDPDSGLQFASSAVQPKNAGLGGSLSLGGGDCCADHANRPRDGCSARYESARNYCHPRRTTFPRPSPTGIVGQFSWIEKTLVENAFAPAKSLTTNAECITF